MGYHVIFRKEKGEIEHKFLKEKYELAYLPINEDTIIYQGEEAWIPELVKSSESYKNFADLRYRGSMQAERLFMDQAIKKKYILEIIDQSKESFKQYYNIVPEFLKIKRGDFLIRNVRNLEVDVKCKSFFKENSAEYFYFEEEDLEKHFKMQELTKTPIIIAIYQRNEKTGTPKPDALFMIDITYMYENVIKMNKLKPKKREWGMGYKIPVDKCMKGFDLIKFYEKK